MTHELPVVTWLNLDPGTIRRPMHGTAIGVPQVLLNYARVSRESWRIKAIIDEQGHPVTSDFLVVRPKVPASALGVVWGLCNSPMGNAYAYCHTEKRHVLAGDMRRMPVPNVTEVDLGRLNEAVADYLEAARNISARAIRQPQQSNGKSKSRQKTFEGIEGREPAADAAVLEHLRILHWRIDAEVLRLYDLPAALERKVLDLFSGVRRRGVPFEQTEYFPKEFTELDRLSDLLAITTDWPKTNKRRAKLLDLEEEDRVTPQQAEELENLQRLAHAE